MSTPDDTTRQSSVTPPSPRDARIPGDSVLGPISDVLPIDGAPSVWYDEPPQDDFHVDIDVTDADPQPVEGAIFPDPETLRGTRFGFGGRRPAAPPVPVRIAPPAASNRPLPNVGTEALGRCFRIEPYGAFVEFLGYRGLVHISQLRPGLRVERVEDEVQIGDEVVVRVIAVDPERRHLNLAMIRRTPAGQDAAVATDVPSTSHSGSDLPSTVATPVRDAGAQVVQPVATAEPAVTTPSTPVIATSPAQPVPQPTPAQARPSDAVGIQVGRGREAATEAPARVDAKPVTPPLPPRGREIAPYMPPARPSTPAPAASSARPGQTAAPKPSAPPAVARTGARAVRRELFDPSHPMARLLATAPEQVIPRQAPRPGAGNQVARSSYADTPVEEAPAEPARLVPNVRPVHIDEPEALPVSDEPATLEALAARFGARPATSGSSSVSRPGAKPPTSRSQQAREAQAEILERMRRQG
jgi:predicted RNA-binding protein with RPS1 domain